MWNLIAIQGFPGSLPNFPGGQPLSLGSLTPSPDSQKLSLINIAALPRFRSHSVLVTLSCCARASMLLRREGGFLRREGGSLGYLEDAQIWARNNRHLQGSDEKRMSSSTLFEGLIFLLACSVHFVRRQFWAISTESQRSRPNRRWTTCIEHASKKIRPSKRLEF